MTLLTTQIQRVFFENVFYQWYFYICVKTHWYNWYKYLCPHWLLSHSLTCVRSWVTILNTLWVSDFTHTRFSLSPMVVINIVPLFLTGRPMIVHEMFHLIYYLWKFFTRGVDRGYNFFFFFGYVVTKSFGSSVLTTLPKNSFCKRN